MQIILRTIMTKVKKKNDNKNIISGPNYGYT